VRRRLEVAGCPAVEGHDDRACAAPEEETLLASGWTRRFVGDARMTTEATALYGSLGYEVLAVPLEAAAADEVCAGCAVTLQGFCVLYTRKPAV
jgi:hypothetical protein